MSQQDPLNFAAQRREVVIATIADAAHPKHRERIRAGVRAGPATSLASAEHRTLICSRLDPAEDYRTDRPLPLDPDTAAGHVGAERAGGLSWH